MAYVREAIAQLLEYRRFFRSKDVRNAFFKKHGIRAYEPRMIILIGRDRCFGASTTIQDLEEELPHDLEIITYDALLERASSYVQMAKRY